MGCARFAAPGAYALDLLTGRDDRLDESVDRIMLARAITDLPPGYRTIFLLHEVEGYEHVEIARMLDFSVGNSKSQLHKAKRRIREFLGVPAARTDYLKRAWRFDPECVIRWDEKAGLLRDAVGCSSYRRA